MSEPFIAEIRIFAGNFAPVGWAFCNGQLLPISQNTALFSLVGTFYGGDGQATFALPHLRDRAPMHPGQGPGLSSRVLGEEGGASSVSLIGAELPAHEHGLNASNLQATTFSPDANSAIARSVGGFAYDDAPGIPSSSLNPSALGIAGASQPHQNMQPYLALSFIIALVGVYPSRP
jgi:microcystin-dependent protein